MTLDQVPTEERTAPLNLSQVPLEMGLGGCLLSFFILTFLLKARTSWVAMEVEFGVHFPVRLGTHVKKMNLCFQACFGVKGIVTF